MVFKELRIENFRNIKSQTLSLNPGLNVLRGQNGQGKSNFVEALSFLTAGRSFRTATINEVVNKNNPIGFQIDGVLSKADFDFRLTTKYTPRDRFITVNLKKVSASRLKRDFPSLLFSPESLSVVKESAQYRRDLLDETCLFLFPEFLSLFNNYKRAHKQKRSLLKAAKEAGGADSNDLKTMVHLNQVMLEYGARLTVLRLAAIEELEPLLLQEFLAIMDEHYGNLSVEYRISGEKTETQNEEQILNAMYKRYEELKAREWASGQCLVGPHKHDINFIFNGQDARFYCSQGQQRAIILAFKMAQTRAYKRAHRVYPILLLDDVLSELDREKQIRFVRYLLSTEAQIFLTTTDATSVPLEAASAVFDVKEGVFKEATLN